MSIRVAIFDVLGTVLDERGSFTAAAEADPSGQPDPAAFARRWLAGVDETTARIADGSEPWQPWDDIVARRLDELVSPDDPRQASRSLASVGHRLAAWPDSAAALERIHAICDTVALSNAGLPALMDSSRLNALTWSALLSSEMIGSAKPDPRVYAFLLDAIRVDPADVLFVSAHPWDLRAAAAHGMRTAFVHRPDEGEPTPEDRFTWRGTSLTELVDALEHDLARVS